MLKQLLLPLFFSFFTNLILAQAPVQVTVSGVENTSGHLIVSVYQTEQQFKENKPYKFNLVDKASAVNGTITTSFKLEKGIYGIAVLDDENVNRKMDYNLFGIPTEGFGFSNYYHNTWSRPTLQNFQFKVDNTPVQVEVAMRYML